MNDWPNAYDLAERAWRFYAAGRWGRALHAMERALEREPDQPAWWLGRGMALDALHRTEEAADAYERAIALDADNVEAWTRLGAAHIRRGDGRRAVAALEQAQHLDPDRHDTYCHRVAAYAQLGDTPQAELMFYLGQQHDDQCPHCFDHIAHMLADQGRLAQAIACWRRVYAIDPGYPQVGANIGRCYGFLKQPGHALPWYEQHLDQHPDDADTTIELAGLLIELDRLDEAEARLERAVAQRPGDAAGHHLLGDLALRRGQPHTAEYCFRAAMDARPNRPGVRLGLALAARAHGDLSTCVRYLHEELDIAGQDARQVLQLARLLNEARQFDHAHALLTPSLDGFDDIFRGSDAMLAEALRLRAIAEAAMGQPDAATADRRRAVRLDPDHLESWRQLAEGYFRAGQPRRAWACLNRAQSLAPDDAHLRKLAAQLRWWRWARAAAAPLRRAA